MMFTKDILHKGIFLKTSPSLLTYVLNFYLPEIWRYSEVRKVEGLARREGTEGILLLKF